MKWSRVTPAIVGFVLLAFAGVSAAQGLSCPDLVAKALEAVQVACAELGRNEACYGNNKIEALFEADATVAFAQPADRAPVDSLRTLRTFALDAEAGLWGVAMLNIQANLPDTLPGQGVKFILYGDTALENADQGDSYGPMQAFYLTTQPGALACQEAPPSQLVIQSPKGYKVSLNANGMDITIGSTIVLSAEPQEQMTIATLEGEAVATFDGETQIIPQGFAASVPLGGEDGLTPLDAPHDLQIIDSDAWKWVADTASEVWDAPVEIVDTSQWTSIDDFCADPANQVLCATDEFAGGFPDCTDDGCVNTAMDCLLGCPSEVEPSCGDLLCSMGEDGTNCPADCSASDLPPELYCGDALCSVGEDTATCPDDCPAEMDSPPPTCGDALCAAGEDSATCEVDCPLVNNPDAPPDDPPPPGDDGGGGEGG